MFYDLNLPWPEAALEAAKRRNASAEHQAGAKALAGYINALAGEPADGGDGKGQSNAGQQHGQGGARKQKGKKRKLDEAQSAAPAVAAEPNAEAGPSKPPQRPVLKPFDPLVGVGAFDRERLRGLTTDAADLGYRFVAYNHVVKGRFEGSAHQSPFYDTRTKEALLPFPLLDPRTRAAERKRRSAAAAAAAAAGKGKARAIDADELWDGRELTQYSRCTLVLDDSSFGKQGHGLTSASTNALLTYDLLAVCPLTEQAFAAACQSFCDLKPNSIDIISFDFAAAPRMPFLLKRSALGAALQNGAVFEICYGALVGAEDVYARIRGDAPADKEALAKARRNLIAGARELLRITNGKGVIISSGAAHVLGLRGPADVANLASVLFGMNQAAAQDALQKTCRAIVKRAETRKTWRGIVGPPALRLVEPRALSGSGAAPPQPPDPLRDMAVGASAAPSDAANAEVPQVLSARIPTNGAPAPLSAGSKKRARPDAEEESEAEVAGATARAVKKTVASAQ